MSERTVHRLEKFRVLETSKNRVEWSAMVCCRAFPHLEIWQRVDFVAARESLERGVHGFECPVLACSESIELNTSEIKRQVVGLASDSPEAKVQP